MIDVNYVDIAKLELEDGDLLLVRTPPDWTSEQIDRAHRAVKTALEQTGKRIPVLYGSTDVDFQVVRRAAA